MKKNAGLSLLRIVILVALVLPLVVGTSSVAPAAGASLFAAGTAKPAPAAAAKKP